MAFTYTTQPEVRAAWLTNHGPAPQLAGCNSTLTQRTEP